MYTTFIGQQSLRRHLLRTQEFSKICLREKIRSVVLRPERKPHWPFFNFDTTFSRCFPKIYQKLLRHTMSVPRMYTCGRLCVGKRYSSPLLRQSQLQ